MVREKLQPEDSSRSNTSSIKANLCKDCLWYDAPLAWGGIGMGICIRARRQGSLVHLSNDGDLKVDTEFGCIQWEEKI
jgi:hypothetical protein